MKKMGFTGQLPLRIDLKEFNLEALEESLLFQPTKGFSKKQKSSPEALKLILGIGALGIAQDAAESDSATRDAISNFLDPIASLDLTASVLRVALSLASIDSNPTPGVVSALILGLIECQNLDEYARSSLSLAASHCLQESLDATEELALTNPNCPNSEWLHFSLRQAWGNSSLSSPLQSRVGDWLKTICGDYENSAKGKLGHWAKRMTDRANQAKTKIDSLREPEAKRFQKFLKRGEDPIHLHRVALHLLAGQRLSGLAEDLACFAFANHIFQYEPSLLELFFFTVRMNRIDWKETRDALSTISDEFIGTELSNWTKSTILFSTGSAKDSAAATSVRNNLTRANPIHEPWRLAEDFCESDPCDPTSKKPANIMKTAKRYASICTSDLATERGQTELDHFFEISSLGLIRFEGDLAISKHQEFVSGATTSPQGGHIALMKALSHHPLVTYENAMRYIADSTNEDFNENSVGPANRLRIELAAPYLSPTEMTEALARGLEENGTIPERLLSYFAKPKSKEALSLLELAQSPVPTPHSTAALAILTQTGAEVLANQIDFILEKVKTGTELESYLCINWFYRFAQCKQLGNFAESGWKADWKPNDKSTAKVIGSLLLIKAAKENRAYRNGILSRLAPSCWGASAPILDPKDSDTLFDYFIRGLEHLTDFRPSLLPPSSATSQTEPCLSSSHEFLNNVGERFLNWIGSRDNQTLQTLCTNRSADQANDWPHARRLELCIAKYLATHLPKDGAKCVQRLIEKSKGTRSIVGPFGIPGEVQILWSAPKSEHLKQAQITALDRAISDTEITFHIVAALVAEKQSELEEYVKSKIDTRIPADIARGLTIAGFAEESPYFSALLKRKDYGTNGFLAQVHQHAQKRYKQNQWAHYWFQEMSGTGEKSEFWRYSKLFCAIVDPRYFAWGSNGEDCSTLVSTYSHYLEDEVRTKIEKVMKKRSSSLFGSKAPEPIIILENTRA